MSATDIWLEHNPRRRWRKDSKAARGDIFAPPATAVPVKCNHCGLSYSSADMVWGTKEGVRTAGPIWWCPTKLCDGAGFGYDVFEVKP